MRPTAAEVRTWTLGSGGACSSRVGSTRKQRKKLGIHYPNFTLAGGTTAMATTLAETARAADQGVPATSRTADRYQIDKHRPLTVQSTPGGATVIPFQESTLDEASVPWRTRPTPGGDWCQDVVVR